MSEVESAERRSWRRFRCWPLSGKAKVLLHHWRYGCRCCRGLRAHVTGKKLLWPPEFASGPEGTARSLPSGQLSPRWREAATGQQPPLGNAQSRSAREALTVVEQSSGQYPKARGCCTFPNCERAPPSASGNFLFQTR